MKLNLSTPPQQVIDTLVREWPMASAAYVRYHGGLKAYDRKQDEFLQTALRTEKSSVHDDFYMEMPDGNKWCVFEHTIFDHGYVHTCHYAFCYWLTQPYGGIFFKVSQPVAGEKDMKPGFVCYDSHFFERLCERGIYQWNGLKTLMQFIADNHANTIYCTDPKNNKWDIRISHAICRGFQHKDCPTAYYIKTVLDDERLTRSQRQTTSMGRRTGDSINKYISLPLEDMFQRLQAKMIVAKANGTLDEFRSEYIRDIAHMLHISQEEAQYLNGVYELILGVILEIKPSINLYVKRDLSMQCFCKAINLLNRWKDEQPDDGGKLDLVNGICAVSKQQLLRISKGAIIRVINSRLKRAKNEF